MYVLKQKPDDFVVEELPSEEWKSSGSHLIVKVAKRDRNTDDVAAEMARSLRISRKTIGYAGAKDKRAVTIQYFSIAHATKESISHLSIKNCEIVPVGFLDKPLRLGMLAGNKFRILVRDVTNTDVHLPASIPNYFDDQRFGGGNVSIGLALMRKDFSEAARLISKEGIPLEGDPLQAIIRLPRNRVKMYLHSVQSLLWNKMVAAYVCDKENFTVPYSQGTLVFPSGHLEQRAVMLPGFGMEYESPFDELAAEALQSCNLTARDYVIKQLPNLSLEGTPRNMLMDVQGFSIEKNEGTLLLRFTLPPGSYATMVVKALLQS